MPWVVQPTGFTVKLVGPGMLQVMHITSRCGQILLFNEKAEPFDREAVQRRVDECCERIMGILRVEQTRRIANDLDGIEGYAEN